MADIKAIAEKLVFIADDALQEIVQMLRDEYGIDVITLIFDEKNEKNISAENFKSEVLRLKDQAQKQHVMVEKAQADARSKPYAPRKIGNPRGFPPNMRRRK